MKNPNQEYTKRLLAAISYSPQSGRLWWNLGSKEFLDGRGLEVWNGRIAGTPAMTGVDKDGYHRGEFEGKGLRAHRVAWLCYYRNWPSLQIDHIDGNPANNRISNLREATAHQNSRNRRANSGATSPYVGVHFSGHKWRAQIQIDSKKVYLGAFDTETEAALARDKASWAKSGKFARLNLKEFQHDESMAGDWDAYVAVNGLRTRANRQRD